MSTVAHPVGVGTRHRSRSSRVVMFSGPVARPARKPVPVRVGAVAACRVTPPRRGARDLVLRLKVAAVALVALTGTVASAAEFASWAEVEPPVEYGSAHPAWEQLAGR